MALQYALSMRAPFCVMKMRTIRWNPKSPSLQVIDQRLLPAELKIIELHQPEEVAAAIHNMTVRGAPAIGVTAAFGLALAGMLSPAKTMKDLIVDLEAAATLLRSARPTAINLNWGLDRVMQTAHEAADNGPSTIRQRLVDEAQRMADDDIAINRRMGKHGAALIANGDTLIHHCNTGALATVDYGTALGVIRTAHEQGKEIHVLVDETRPLLQGARLTAWELDQYSIDHDIITDNAAGYFLSQGNVNSVFVGADRIAANGDIANKIGTYMLSLAAYDNQVPFYCVAPTSTIDLSLQSGKQIPIEERDPSEVLNLQCDGKPIAPSNSKARNPAFDITSHTLVTAIITEAGISRPPYLQSLAKAVEKA